MLLKYKIASLFCSLIQQPTQKNTMSLILLYKEVTVPVPSLVHLCAKIMSAKLKTICLSC